MDLGYHIDTQKSMKVHSRHSVLSFNMDISLKREGYIKHFASSILTLSQFPMRDYLIRSAFHQTILKTAHECGDTFVVDELGLKNGSYRADIAVLNGKLIGYEIKTDSDNLIRLPNQIKAYNEVFDNAYIIVGKKHIRCVEDMLPEWWGIYLIEDLAFEQYSFKVVRKAKKNYTIDSFGLAQLLWKNEVAEILTSSFNYFVSSRTTKEELYDILSFECSPKKLSAFVHTYLKSRQSWRINL